MKSQACTVTDLFFSGRLGRYREDTLEVLKPFLLLLSLRLRLHTNIPQDILHSPAPSILRTPLPTAAQHIFLTACRVAEAVAKGLVGGYDLCLVHIYHL